MVQIDMDYIQNASLWLDLKVMLLTPIEMLKKKG
jgi:lipopolysaccharide/colanic/teichoic acid biosynthesis glycosyltransferase